MSKHNVLIRTFGTVLICAMGALPAHADISGITARFAGGCATDNTTGSCTIKATASGTDLEQEGVRLYVQEKKENKFRLVSHRIRALSTSGTVALRFKNIPGASFQLRSAPNGNDKPDARSNTLTEK